VANKVDFAFNKSNFQSAILLRDLQTCVKAHANSQIYLTDAWCGLTTADPTPRKILPNTARLSRDYVEIVSTDLFIGVQLDTSQETEFTLRPICEGTATGRLVLLCYDANGVQMTSASDGRDLLAGIDWPSNRATTFPWSPSIAGGCFYAANDLLLDRGATIRVTDAVKTVFVGVTGGTLPARLKALQIVSQPSKRQPGQRAVTVRHVLPASDESYATADPDTLTGTFGVYAKGEEVHNFNPASAAPGSWRCATARPA
jgi:hypothetical protein